MSVLLRAPVGSSWIFGLSIAAASAACGRPPIALEVRAIEQTSAMKEPMFLLRCGGGGPRAHYRWQLGVGLRAIPSAIDAPVLLVSAARARSSDIEIKCTVQDDGAVPVIASAMLEKSGRP